jgi:hypothetical protein
MDFTEQMYEGKYLKYKTKYQILKQQQGSAPLFNSTTATISKGSMCPNWKYFFIFDESIKFKSVKRTKGANSEDTEDTSEQNVELDDTKFEYIDPTIKYTDFKEKVNYRAYILIDESIVGTNLFGYNRLGLSLANKITETDAVNIEKKFTGIIEPKSKFALTSSRSSNKNINFYQIPSSVSLFNIDLYDKKLVENINTLITASGIKIASTEINPKIVKIVSFLGENINQIYDVKYDLSKIGKKDRVDFFDHIKIKYSYNGKLHSQISTHKDYKFQSRSFSYLGGDSVEKK